LRTFFLSIGCLRHYSTHLRQFGKLLPGYFLSTLETMTTAPCRSATTKTNALRA
jgi:hypothetical protein